MVDRIPSTARAVHIGGTATVARAMRRIFGDCLIQIASNRAALQQMTGPEAVHQMRIGLRRTRSALKLFEHQIDKTSRQTINARLRETGRLLSASRDWQVFLTVTLPQVAHLPDLDVEQVTKIAHQRKLVADDAAWTALRGEPAHCISATCISVTIATQANQPFRDIVPPVLSKQAKQVRRKLDCLTTSADRHVARKALKRLRYNVEFVESLYPHRQVKKYLECCKTLQDALGEANDRRTIRELWNDDPLVAPILLWADKNAEAMLKNLDKMVRAFRKAPKFWR